VTVKINSGVIVQIAHAFIEELVAGEKLSYED
jgi:hypothetical protein